MPCTIPYFKSVLIALDQLINAILRGWSDETLSSRFWRWHMSGKRSWPCKIVDTIFFWDRDGEKRHCELSFISEKERLQAPPESRN